MTNFQKLDIHFAWGGTGTGILLKNSSVREPTKKIIGIHGWLDNLNSMLPLAEKLVERHPNFEIYLYDRAGHGFSSHLPKGSDYSHAVNLRDLRDVILTLGWNRAKFSIIGHSYGAMLAFQYAAAYPTEVSHLIAIDALLRANASTDNLWIIIGERVDIQLRHFYDQTTTNRNDLTMDKVLQLTIETRPGITNEAAKRLSDRMVYRDSENNLQFTRDPSLKIFPSFIFTTELVRIAIQSIKASVLFIGAAQPQWPLAQYTIDLLKKYNKNFEMTLIDGPHHLHMTHVDEVVENIDQYINSHPDEPVRPNVSILSKL